MRRAIGAVLVVGALFIVGSWYAVDRALDHLQERVAGADPPSPDKFGTGEEVGSRGDPPDGGELFGGAYPNDGNTQARALDQPARLSGYTVFVRSIERVPANTYVDGYAGDYLRVNVRVFNRDVVAQTVSPSDFHVWHHGTTRTPDVVGAPALTRPAELASGLSTEGDLYLYVGAVTDDLFVVFEPASPFDDAQAVWQAA